MSNIKEKPTDNFFKCIKIPIKNVLKHYDINLPKITDAVLMCNKIVIHTLMFMKLYLLDYYETHKCLPIIDNEFVNSCMKILCNESTNGRPPKKEIKELKDTLKIFLEKHYKPLMQNDELNYKHMNTILDYLTIDIITMYDNNIKLHYVEYVERFVNVVWKKKYMIEKIRKLNSSKGEIDNKINKLCNQLRRIKNDILNVETNEYKSDKSYHKWINNIKKSILPNKDVFNKNNIHYDIQCKPQDYLPCMIYMMKYIEQDGLSINNVFPLRNEIVPKHIRIDTTTLVHLMMRKEQGNKCDYLTKGNLKKNEDKIWEFFLRTERRCFKKNEYTFHHMIETDGVSCSIVLIRNDLIGKRIPSSKNKNNEKYIDELDDYKPLQNKKIVAIDPGKCDILYCVDSYNKDATTFRYTQDSRRKETKSKKYSKLILEFKKEKIDGKTIIEYETELSQFNKKSLDIEKYKEYIKKKNEINNKLFAFYNKYIFRKLKLNGYMNRLKNEQKLMNKFQKVFGDKNDVVVCFGDFEQQKHMKYKEPIKGKGMRTLFRKSGYETYLVDEFRTSCKCCNCNGGDCEKFMLRKNPKSWKTNYALVHGLLRCKSGCGLWNRDTNGAKNIYKISYNHINNIERPLYLSRSKKSGTLHDVP